MIRILKFTLKFVHEFTFHANSFMIRHWIQISAKLSRHKGNAMRSLLFLSMFFICDLAHSKDKDVLRVYTYSSFASEWGPGPILKREFEANCNCEIKLITVADGNALLARIKLESSAPKADLVIGIEDALIASAMKTNQFLDPQISMKRLEQPKSINKTGPFIPYNFGYYAFMFDTKAKDPSGSPFPQPASMNELLTSPKFIKSIIVQDPRTSAPGLALLLWIKALYKDKAPEKYKLLQKQILTVTRGWSESYKLFTKGEAPLVFSYTTSEAYHREEEKTDRYKALIFTEGHYISVEYAAILKTSKKENLAKRFIEYLLSPSAQSIIAHKNWMYPTQTALTLPKSYDQILQPAQTLQIKSDEILINRENWIREWQKETQTN